MVAKLLFFVDHNPVKYALVGISFVIKAVVSLGGLHQTFYNNLTIIFKAGVPQLIKVNLKCLITISIRHPIKNIEFARSLVNKVPWSVFKKLFKNVLQSIF